ncbi:MAG: rod shape-determining protein MreD [Desulfitobacteriaceae bacterium]|nr:rod shape-determining protein MreD [Desulfitobacteriaceae bacterium]
MLLISFVLQGTVFYFWDWFGIKPDLVMLLVIYIALHSRLFTGMLWGLGIGIIEDLYLGYFIGMSAFTFAGVALLSNWLAQRCYKENLLFIVLLVFSVSVVGELLAIFLSLGAGMHWQLGAIVRISVGIACYNLILVPATYPLIHRSFLYGWLRYRPKYEQ